MRLECRCFNESGLGAAAAALQWLRDRPDDELPPALLTDPALSAVVGRTLSLPQGGFGSRWLLGAWLYGQLSKVIPDVGVLRRSGFWSWLAFYLFPLVRPPGTRVFEDARYILNPDDFRKRYRHLVAGPYYVFLAHESQPNAVRGLLAAPPHAPGDLYEQFASRQELITSVAVMQAITRMYLDPEKGSLKRGSAANARRLAEVLMQYDVTYDFSTIPCERLIAMLPREFRRFTHVE